MPTPPTIDTLRRVRDSADALFALVTRTLEAGSTAGTIPRLAGLLAGLRGELSRLPASESDTADADAAEAALRLHGAARLLSDELRVAPDGTPTLDPAYAVGLMLQPRVEQAAVQLRAAIELLARLAEPGDVGAGDGAGESDDRGDDAPLSTTQAEEMLAKADIRFSAHKARQVWLRQHRVTGHTRKQWKQSRGTDAPQSRGNVRFYSSKDVGRAIAEHLREAARQEREAEQRDREAVDLRERRGPAARNGAHRG